MSNIGSNGIYRLYRVYPQQDGKHQQRLVGVFAIIGGAVHVMEDHDDILEDLMPEGPLDDRGLYRMYQLEESPYWRLVLESDVDQGEHPDLLPHFNIDGQPTQAQAPEPSVKVEDEPKEEG